MHGYCNCVYYYFINFTFHTFFLSLFSVQNELSLRLLLSSSSFSLDTHKHTHTQNTQRHPLKQINTEIHKHTHTDKPTERQIGAGVGRLWIGAGGARLEFMGRRKWVWMLVDRCWRRRSVLVGQREWVLMLWISAGGGDWCLWVDWNKSLHVHLSLWVGACGGDGCLRRLKGRTQVEEIWLKGSGD